MRVVTYAQKGFSLVELMIVVAIIGILSALAVPKFQTFQARARQSEVKVSLAQMATLQEAFYANNDAYADVPAVGKANNCAAVNNPIGFSPEPCASSRYVYSADANGVEFTAEGTSEAGAQNLVFPGCTVADTWEINQDRVLTNTSNGIVGCINQ